ncbi:MAG: DUF4007 family protein [Myxococcota bacterium]|nr:DUF4007 family protein [Myxococcota bacterium]
MRFGGHETFPIRLGWLSKALILIDKASQQQQPLRALDSVEVFDALGVGRNMAKSIWHWLQVTRLAEKAVPELPALGETAVETHKGKREQSIRLTALGRLLVRRDRYLQRVGSWWALHANIVSQRDAALAWRWFFNDFPRTRFDRGHCLDEFAHYAQREFKRKLSLTTLSRDVSCMLASYSRTVPVEVDDPENASHCPLSELNLLVHFRDAAMYERGFRSRSIPPELFGYSLAVAQLGSFAEDSIQLSFNDALVVSGSPGRIFALDAEGLAALVSSTSSHSAIAFRELMHGGERVLEGPARTEVFWLNHYFDRLGATKE